MWLLNKTSFFVHQHLPHKFGFPCGRQLSLQVLVIVLVILVGPAGVSVSPEGPGLGSKLLASGQAWSGTVGFPSSC